MDFELEIARHLNFESSSGSLTLGIITMCVLIWSRSRSRESGSVAALNIGIPYGPGMALEEDGLGRVLTAILGSEVMLGSCAFPSTRRHSLFPGFFKSFVIVNKNWLAL